MNIYLVTVTKAQVVIDEHPFLDVDIAREYINLKYPTFTLGDVDRNSQPTYDRSLSYFDASRCNDDMSIDLKLLYVLTRRLKQVVDFVPVEP